MGSQKHKKRAFSEEQKQKIKQLKNRLLAKGVPREEWSSIIQQELMLQGLMKKNSTAYKEKVEPLSPFKQIRQDFSGFLKRIVLKRFHIKNDVLMKKMFEDTIEEFSDEEMELADSQLPNFKAKNIEKLKLHGTFIADRPDKKRMIVDLDDEDEKK